MTLSERFWQKVTKRRNQECWNWTASMNEAGYGIIGLGSRQQGTDRAHRVSWRLHFGEIPKGMFVLQCK